VRVVLDNLPGGVQPDEAASQQCDVMSHVVSDHVDWRSVSEDVIRSSVRGTVPVLACVVGNRGVRSPG
jgi:hypothetical protein